MNEHSGPTLSLPAAAVPAASTPIGTTALKEWAIAVQALMQGEMVVLLRKGGIREATKTFVVPQPQVWLYPTYEHQNPQLLKADYASQVQSVPSGWHPETIELQGWARITHHLQLTEASAVAALDAFHIWNPLFVTDRLRWKPQTPLTLLLLRVYRLPQPFTIPYRSEYGGCRSWIELEKADLPLGLPLADSASGELPGVPVLTETAYGQQVETLLHRCQPHRQPSN